MLFTTFAFQMDLPSLSRLCFFSLLGKTRLPWGLFCTRERRWSRLEKTQSTWVTGELGGCGGFPPVNISGGGDSLPFWVADRIWSCHAFVGTGRMS